MQGEEISSDGGPPSPWAAAAAGVEPPPAPPAAPPPRHGFLREHETLVSVGLGMLLGGGVILLLGSLLTMLS